MKRFIITTFIFLTICIFIMTYFLYTIETPYRTEEVKCTMEIMNRSVIIKADNKQNNYTTKIKDPETNFIIYNHDKRVYDITYQVDNIEMKKILLYNRYNRVIEISYDFIN